MNKTKLQRFHYILKIFIKISLGAAIISSVITASWMNFFLSILAFILSIIPEFIEKKKQIDMPDIFEIIFLVFIYSSIFLGEVQQFYSIFWWWDLFLHTLSGFTLGIIGFLILYMLYQDKKFKASPILIVIFGFSFAVAIGSIWEIFEFTMDSILGFNMQKSGLIDTMSDLIVDAIGAAVAAFVGYFYLIRKKIKKKLILIRKLRK